jgi:hypothetical protein
MSNIKLFESKQIRSVWDDEAQRGQAKVGCERLEEIKNSELAARRCASYTRPRVTVTNGAINHEYTLKTHSHLTAVDSKEEFP